MAAAEVMYAGTREECLKLANELAKRYSISLEAVYRAMILLDFSLVAGMPYSLVYPPRSPQLPPESFRGLPHYPHLHLHKLPSSSLFTSLLFFFFSFCSCASLPYSLMRGLHACRHPCSLTAPQSSVSLHLHKLPSSSLFTSLLFFFFSFCSCASLPYSLMRGLHACRHPCSLTAPQSSVSGFATF